MINFIKSKHRTTPLWLKVLIPMLGLGALGALLVIGAFVAFVITAWLGQPIPVLGFDQSVQQPFGFSHTIHAGLGTYSNSAGESVQGLGIDCTFCHRTVTTQASAGVPPVQLCAYCHQVIGKEDSKKLTTLRTHAGIIGDEASPIPWRRVHRLPDHVHFVHEPHIRYLTANPDRVTNSTSGVTTGAAGVCSTCHGDVASMTEVAQVEELKMGQCVDCHKDNNAPSDCAACHY